MRDKTNLKKLKYEGGFVPVWVLAKDQDEDKRLWKCAFCDVMDDLWVEVVFWAKQ